MYGNSFGGPRGGMVPVKVDQELDVKIEAVGEKGDGIAKVKGFVLFIPNVNVGDEVRVKVTRVLRKVGFADVIGKAQAPVETDDAQSSEEPAAEEAPQEDTYAESPEDSEDFGEEAPAEEASEEPAAEEEAPAEEASEEPAAEESSEEEKPAE